jgi:hypothetical protein
VASTTPADRALIDAVHHALAAAGDPEVAAKQQAYLKSEMPYFGLPAPRLSAELRPLLRDWRHRRARAWLDVASLNLWRTWSSLVRGGTWRTRWPRTWWATGWSVPS